MYVHIYFDIFQNFRRVGGQFVCWTPSLPELKLKSTFYDKGKCVPMLN
jgi:hypothetical protein